MLAAARQTDAGERIRWVEADLADWAPPAPVDVLFSNAALHWLDDHATLFPRLAGWLAPGGVLAVQMPHNHAAPSHRLAVEAARGGPWRERLAPVLREWPVGAPADYHDILVEHVDGLDLWETEYLHVLEGEDPVAQWTKGSLLRPLLAALTASQAEAFEADYRRRLRTAYPRRDDGTTLFPFRRLFLVADRRQDEPISPS